MSKTKTPIRRYECDDIEVMLQGETYKPHVGEWVDIRGGLTWAFQKTSAEYMVLVGKPMATLSFEERSALVRCMDEVAEFVASRIVAWNWTGDDGKALQNPPTTKTISALTDDEVFALISFIRGGRAEGNSLGDSTST